MSFVYDDENQCYSMTLNDILFSCEALELEYESIAKRLSEKYNNALPVIASYISNNEEFIETYGRMSDEDVLEMLEDEEMTIPWIFIKGVTNGTIAYCDEDYVIEFCFYGYFERFEDLEICS